MHLGRWSFRSVRALPLAVALVVALANHVGSARADAFPIRIASSGPQSVHPGASFSYVATLTNTSSASVVVFLQELSGPSESVAVAVPSQGSCDVQPTVRLCALGSIAGGASASVSFVATNNGPAGSAFADLAAMPTATGGASSSGAYHYVVIANGLPLLTDVRLSVAGPTNIPLRTLGSYTITATNFDSRPAHGVQLYGQIGDIERLVRGSNGGMNCPFASGWSPPALVCTVGDLAAGASAEMTVQSLADTSGTSSVTTWLGEDWNSTTTLIQGPSVGAPIVAELPTPTGTGTGTGLGLALNIAPPLAPVSLGIDYSWTETVSNQGATDSGPVLLSTGVGGGAFEILDGFDARCPLGNRLTTFCNIPNVAPGQSVTFTFTAYPYTGTIGEHFSTASNAVSSASESWPVTIFDSALTATDLSVEPDVQLPTVIEGTNSTATWKVTNHGPATAHGMVLIDSVTPATTKVGRLSVGASCPARCELGDLAPGASMFVAIRTSGPDAVVHHSVRIEHSEFDPVAGNDTASVDAAAVIATGGGGGGGGGTSVPDLSVTLVPRLSTIAPGDADEIVVYVKNSGGAGALQTHLELQLPPAIALLGAPFFERGSGCTGTSVIDCFLDYIPNGETTRVILEVRATSAGDPVISATASSDREANPSDNTASITVHVGTFSPPSTPGPTPTAKHGKTINGDARANHLTGTPYADILNGLSGNDGLDGRAGNDTLNGGPGNDVIRARDGQRDIIDCGSGNDVVYADRTDHVASNCEVVHHK
jgi:hypothetical protein